MEFKLTEYSIYEVGKRADANGNPQQEDSIYPPHGADASQSRLFIVCDGMGGHDAGEVASETVCESLSSDIISAQDPDGVFTVHDLQRAITAAYEALDAKDTGDDRKMGTTMALLKLHRAGYTVAHMGDSRVYHIRPGRTAKDTCIIFRTEDHSLVNYMLRTGQMTPQEAATSPKRHVITRAMQPNMEHRSKADIYESADVRTGDYFMLCTDGIYENIDDDYIRYLFSEDGGSDKNKVSQLTKATQNNKDNHSAIIVHLTTVGASPAINRSMETTPVRDKQKTKTAKAADSGKRTLTAKGGRLELMTKFMFAVIALLTVVMAVYYMLIRTDEDLQRAGTAIDQQGQTDGAIRAEETYGYEITQQDIINEAQQIAPEYSDPEPAEADNEAEADTDEQQTEQSDTQEPHSESEPILQE